MSIHTALSGHHCEHLLDLEVPRESCVDRHAQHLHHRTQTSSLRETINEKENLRYEARHTEAQHTPTKHKTPPCTNSAMIYLIIHEARHTEAQHTPTKHKTPP